MPTKNEELIGGVEFVNLADSDISPFVAECEIKICYSGNNRNGSNLSEDVLTNMAKTVRGCPIVGYFKEDKDDFRDHGREINISGDGMEFLCRTKPYGFVPPDAPLWFQKFSETNEDGSIVERKYLMTKGLLWRKQFEETEKIFNEGRPQSMELDDDSLEGYWAKQKNETFEIFIVTDATISKLCILGKDVEPCFEGANITSPKISSGNNFTKDLYNMMKEFTYYSKSEGEFNLDANKTSIEEVFEKEEKKLPEETDHACGSGSKDDKKKKYAGKEEDKKEKESSNSKDKKDEDNDDDEEKKKYSLLEQKYLDLESKFSEIVKEYSELKAFKEDVETKRKDELIAEFYMLSNEDKADVIAHKKEYSYDEIDAKLSVIARKKKVNFSIDPNVSNEDSNVPTTFACEHNDIGCFESELVSAIRATKAARDNI